MLFGIIKNNFKGGFFVLDIFKLIYEYSKNGRLVDKEFIEKLVQLEIRMKKLETYIHDVKFSTKCEKNEKAIASYRTGILNIYMLKIYEMLENSDKYLDLFFDIEKIFYQNTNVSQIILHEIEHANQAKKRRLSKAIEGDILRLSAGVKNNLQVSSEFFQKCMTNPKWIASYYNANYFYSPNERLAEIRSNNEMATILSYHAEYLPNLLEFFKIRELEALTMGYLDKNSNLISPTLTYLQGMEMDKYLLECSWYNEENFRTLNDTYKNQFNLTLRQICGFPIDEEEYLTSLDILIRSRFYATRL